MIRPMLAALLCSVLSTAAAQPLLKPAGTENAEAVLAGLPDLARQAIPLHHDEDRQRYLGMLFRLQSVAGDHEAAAATIETLIKLRAATDPAATAPLRVFQIAERARANAAPGGVVDDAGVGLAFASVFEGLSDVDSSRAIPLLTGDPDRLRADLLVAAERHVGSTGIALQDALALIRMQSLASAFEVLVPRLDALVAADDERRYLIDRRTVVATPDGATIAAVVARPRRHSEALPTLLRFTIYVDEAQSLANVRDAAARGYAGVVAYTRGKAWSRQAPVPYEHDGDDARAVIDWISDQSWSDGRVGMYGGSYDGFTQWAAAKRMPEALKTMVPWVAHHPGNGLPMENNVFLLVNHAWPFFVTNNKTLDDAVYADHERWSSLNQRWYRSGASYREIDRIDGTPNPWFQRWLEHPRYDAFWASMTPQDREFAAIDIPVLTITGYFDDGQQSALGYYRQHLEHRRDARHVLLIGPWDHGGSQASRKPPVVNGYQIDPVALIDTPEITYQWMDHVFRGRPKPELLREPVNYQIMGTNRWGHAGSIAAMARERRTWYLSADTTGRHHLLSERPDEPMRALAQRVDFADRESSLGDTYPNPVIGKTLDASSGLVFESAPFDEPLVVAGMFSGELHVTSDRRDFDFAVTLYERMPSGELFQLSYIIARASHVRSPARRQLLTPGRLSILRFERTRFTSRQMQPGSRLVLAVSVNKNPFAQVNYGTGGDVSDENIDDAGEPLTVKWHTGSRIHVPLSR